MAPVSLIISIILIPLAIGAGVAYLGYQQYKARRFAVPDMERTQRLENMPHRQWQEVELTDIVRPEKQYYSGQWYGSSAIVPADIASVAKPLPSGPYLKYTGGEGLVSPPERIFLSTEEGSEGYKRRGSKLDQFHEQEVYAGRPWDLEKDGHGNVTSQQPEVQCPNPVRPVTKKPAGEPANTTYDAEQTAASDIWDRINKGEILMPKWKPERKLMKTSVDGMEDVDLNSAKVWVNAQGPGSTVTRFPNGLKSIDCLATVVDTNNVNIQRPLSHVKRKVSIDSNIATPPQEVDRAAEARCKMLEAKKQRAKRQKQEEEEQLRQEERRLIQEQEEREAEERRRTEESQQREDEENEREFDQMTTPKHLPENTNEITTTPSRLHSLKRKPNTSTRRASTSSTSRPSCTPPRTPISRSSQTRQHHRIRHTQSWHPSPQSDF